jgi:acyl carrier protein
VEERLRRVLGEVFEMEEGEIDSDSSPENVALWDSLHHLKMITELEAVFDVRFSMREIRSMTTFPKIKEILAFHLDGMKSRPDGGE